MKQFYEIMQIFDTEATQHKEVIINFKNTHGSAAGFECSLSLYNLYIQILKVGCSYDFVYSCTQTSHMIF